MISKESWGINILFWLHLPIVLLWFGLFLFPLSIWPGRITFHFFYISGIMSVQLLWAFYLHRFDIICPMTTLMQWMRGFSLKDEKNYGHSFIAELVERLGINLSYKIVNYLLFVTLIVVTIQFVWFN